MNILILAETYPSRAQPNAMAFVHARAQHYLAAGHGVEVLSFAKTDDRVHEGVRVRTEATIGDISHFDVVHSHAPNVRNHLRWLRSRPGKPVVWFIHGHELLDTWHYYPRPYAFQRGAQERMTAVLRAGYDVLKRIAFHRFCKEAARREQQFGFVFVSEWMQREAQACNPWLSDGAEVLRSAIVPNPVHSVFRERSYRPAAQMLGDVICIRPLDPPKYAVDQVSTWAVRAPHLSFHVYGIGHYFEHYPAPSNLTVIQRFIDQPSIPELLNRYRVAAMPTRLDSQGVMACEMATYGIPLLTSDLDVPRQMLSGFANVRFVASAADAARSLSSLPQSLDVEDPVRDRFEGGSLAAREIEFSQRLIDRAKHE